MRLDWMIDEAVRRARNASKTLGITNPVPVNMPRSVQFVRRHKGKGKKKS